MAKSRTPISLASVQADLEAARTRIAELEGAEDEALQKSDEAYAAWLRQKRLADAEVARLEQQVDEAAAEAEAQEARARLAEYDARYKAAAARNKEIEKRLRENVPQAWATIAQFIEDAAEAQVETDAVIRAMPPGYNPKIWIGDPDRSVRCAPPQEYEVLSDATVQLWVDPATGGIFANQEQKTRRAVKKSFREVKYLDARPIDEPLPFYRAIRMPRLDAVGDHFLYDGSRVHGPHEALAAVRKSRSRPAPSARPVLTKLEPIDQAATRVADGPAVSS